MNIEQIIAKLEAHYDSLPGDTGQVIDKLESHQKWLRGDKEGIRADFTDFDFTESGVDFTYYNGYNFKDVILVNANLQNMDLSSINAPGADFSGAILTNSKFQEANLKGAKFTGAKADGVICSYADFSSADLSNAVFRNSDFKCANLTDATLDGSDFSSVNFTQGYHLLFGECVSDFDAILDGVDLTNVYIDRALLSTKQVEKMQLEYIRYGALELESKYSIFPAGLFYGSEFYIRHSNGVPKS
jgi:uncharacterized protein YjbI with pentapeptide repeats